MSTILYINDEFCVRPSQLLRYFEEDYAGDTLRLEIIDDAKSGIISSWLRDKQLEYLASRIDEIDFNLGDSEYWNRLSKVMGANAVVEKPNYSSCFTLGRIKCSYKDDILEVTVPVEVTNIVNENYMLTIAADMHRCHFTINTSRHKVGEIVPLVATFENLEKQQSIKLFAEIDHVECWHSTHYMNGNEGQILIMKDSERKFEVFNDEGKPIGEQKYTQVLSDNTFEGLGFVLGVGNKDHQLYYISNKSITKICDWKGRSDSEYNNTDVAVLKSPLVDRIVIQSKDSSGKTVCYFSHEGQLLNSEEFANHIGRDISHEVEIEKSKRTKLISFSPQRSQLAFRVESDSLEDIPLLFENQQGTSLVIGERFRYIKSKNALYEVEYINANFYFVTGEIKEGERGNGQVTSMTASERCRLYSAMDDRFIMDVKRGIYSWEKGIVKSLDGGFVLAETQDGGFSVINPRGKIVFSLNNKHSIYENDQNNIKCYSNHVLMADYQKERKVISCKGNILCSYFPKDRGNCYFCGGKLLGIILKYDSSSCVWEANINYYEGNEQTTIETWNKDVAIKRVEVLTNGHILLVGNDWSSRTNCMDLIDWRGNVVLKRENLSSIVVIGEKCYV